MKLQRIILSGIAACLMLAMVLTLTAQPAESACGSCGAAGKAGAHSHAVSAGTGYSALEDAQKAGVEAATKAKKNIGKTKPKLVLVFGMAKKFDQAKALEGVTSVFDANLVYGCGGYNTITEEGNAGTVSVLALGGDIAVTPVLAADKDLSAAGKKIGEGLKKASEVKASGKVVILIGDCHVPSNDKVVKGISSIIGDSIPVVGGAAMGGMTYCKGKTAGKGKNIGILITGNFLVGCSTLNKGPAEIHANPLVAAAGQAFKDAVGKNLKHTAMVFAFDCGGRRGRMGKDRPEELKAMQKVVGTKMPLIGFYGSGEMGPKACGQPSKGVGYHISACALINK
ncbi:MAG: FIST C-terminal domain-containing protein [Phycisphaerae bacterium]|jgi:hypothetical protein|nr:FIST C-terminal domain-containing protein [Phycisphaerae bacterium]